MSPKSFKHSQTTPGFAISPQGRMSSKSSVFKHLRKLIGGEHPTSSQAQPLASSPTSAEMHRRRAEALKACGLLKQSVKYGGPYRDEPYCDDEDETKIVVSPRLSGRELEKEKDLLIFEDKIEGFVEPKEYNPSTLDEKKMSVSPPTSPLIRDAISDTSNSAASTIESDSSTIVPRHPPIRMRRIGSIVEEIDQIEDEESRRLAEVAFLS